MNFPLLIIFYFVLGDLAISLIKGPLEALLGIAYGIIGGILLWYIPAKGVSVHILLTSLQLLSIIFFNKKVYETAIDNRENVISNSASYITTNLELVVSINYH